MKIINLTKDSEIYTSNVYFLLGTWNAIKDMNTLVDVGRDPIIIDTIKGIRTGVGKKRVDQVILTHNHSDHAGLLPLVYKTFNPSVYAFTRSLKGVTLNIKDGDLLTIGDRRFEIIHTPGHSNDSICLYCEEEGLLFTGDFPVAIQSIGGTYEKNFIEALEGLCRKDIKTIFPGHGAPITENCNKILKSTLRNTRDYSTHHALRRSHDAG